MTISRREFGRLAGAVTLVLASAASIELSGCNVWTDIETWVPVGIAAFESVVTLVAPLASPAVTAIAETVKAGFAALAAAVNQYISAPASQKTTFLAKVQLIFEDIATNLQGFLNAVNVGTSNPIIKIVLGLVNIILSTIAGFVSQIGPATASRVLRLAGQSTTVTPVNRTKKSFKRDFNAACVAAGHPEAEIN
jgi:hypothetical protein